MEIQGNGWLVTSLWLTLACQESRKNQGEGWLWNQTHQEPLKQCRPPWLSGPGGHRGAGRGVQGLGAQGGHCAQVDLREAEGRDARGGAVRLDRYGAWQGKLFEKINGEESTWHLDSGKQVVINLEKIRFSAVALGTRAPKGRPSGRASTRSEAVLARHKIRCQRGESASQGAMSSEVTAERLVSQLRSRFFPFLRPNPMVLAISRLSRPMRSSSQASEAWRPCAPWPRPARPPRCLAGRASREAGHR